MADRNELAEKLELIGRIFAIDGVDALVEKYEKGMGIVKFNAVTIQLEGLLLKADKVLADQLVASYKGIDAEDVQKMENAEYAAALRDAITKDIIGFFA